MAETRDDPGARRGGVTPMQVALNRYLRESGLGAKLRHVQVYRAWKQALGVALAARAKPVRFEDGELDVVVNSSAHFDELTNFTGETYRKKANQRLGSERIRRVTFRLER